MPHDILTTESVWYYILNSLWEKNKQEVCKLHTELYRIWKVGAILSEGNSSVQDYYSVSVSCMCHFLIYNNSGLLTGEPSLPGKPGTPVLPWNVKKKIWTPFIHYRDRLQSHPFILSLAIHIYIYSIHILYMFNNVDVLWWLVALACTICLAFSLFLS